MFLDFRVHGEASSDEGCGIHDKDILPRRIEGAGKSRRDGFFLPRAARRGHPHDFLCRQAATGAAFTKIYPSIRPPPTIPKSTAISSHPGTVFDERAAIEFLAGQFQFLARVHHDRPLPGDRPGPDHVRIPHAVAVLHPSSEHAGDRFDAAVRMPGEARQGQRRIGGAQIVREQHPSVFLLLDSSPVIL
jgi:hypothetical protein